MLLLFISLSVEYLAFEFIKPFNVGYSRSLKEPGAYNQSVERLFLLMTFFTRESQMPLITNSTDTCHSCIELKARRNIEMSSIRLKECLDFAWPKANFRITYTCRGALTPTSDKAYRNVKTYQERGGNQKSRTVQQDLLDIAASKVLVPLTALLRTNASVSTKIAKLLAGIYIKRRHLFLTVQACRSAVL